MRRVAAYTQGVNTPSARFRVRQYIPALQKREIEVTEFASEPGAYPPTSRLARPIWAVHSLSRRLPAIARSYGYDITLLQREMFSTFYTLEGLTHGPRVLDVDDAIWTHRGGGFAERLARLCDAIICGQGFLAEQFGRWNRHIYVVPTAVDTTRFVRRDAPPQRPTIGWSGGSSAFGELERLEPVLRDLMRANADLVFRVVADRPPTLESLPPDRIEFIRWSPRSEVAAIQGMSVGIMPLEDSVWNRGKCSYKMLLYMACGLPVVVSPVGMNRELLAEATIGWGAVSPEDWRESLQTLLLDEELARTMGRAGRRLIEERFSVERIADDLACILKKTA